MALRQVLALQWFELSLDNMYLHNYEECSKGFQKVCILHLKTWQLLTHLVHYPQQLVSRSVFLHFSCLPYRTLPRTQISGSRKSSRYHLLCGLDKRLIDVQREHAEEAERLLKKVPEHIGKRRIMARQLPFDVFVSRKLQKWEQRASEWKIDLIDAVGVSPVEEMTFFWNGFKKMRPEHLEISLQKLAWSTSEANPHWAKETLDEKALLMTLRASILRNLGRRKEAREILQKEVISHPWANFKGGVKDNWTCPVAHYEMAVSYWADYSETGDVSELDESSKWLNKVAVWEAYDLDAR